MRDKFLPTTNPKGTFKKKKKRGWKLQSRKGFCTFVPLPLQADKKFLSIPESNYIMQTPWWKKTAPSLPFFNQRISQPSFSWHPVLWTKTAKPSHFQNRIRWRPAAETALKCSWGSPSPRNPCPQSTTCKQTSRTKNPNHSDRTRSQTSAGANPCFESARNRL